MVEPPTGPRQLGPGRWEVEVPVVHEIEVQLGLELGLGETPEGLGAHEREIDDARYWECSARDE